MRPTSGRLWRSTVHSLPPRCEGTGQSCTGKQKVGVVEGRRGEGRGGEERGGEGRGGEGRGGRI